MLGRVSHDVQVALHGGVPGADAGGPVRRARPVLLALLAVALILLAWFIVRLPGWCRWRAGRGQG